MTGRGLRALILTTVLLAGVPLAHAGEDPAAATAATAEAAATSTSATASTAGGGGPEASAMVQTLLRATRQLGLTATQQAQIDQILANERLERQASTTALPDLTVLGNPDSPGYSAAVSNAEAQATQRIESASALEKSIYAVLTSEQRKALPQVLAQMQNAQRPPTRRAAADAREPPGAGG